MSSGTLEKDGWHCSYCEEKFDSVNLLFTHQKEDCDFAQWNDEVLPLINDLLTEGD